MGVGGGVSRRCQLPLGPSKLRLKKLDKRLDFHGLPRGWKRAYFGSGYQRFIGSIYIKTVLVMVFYVFSHLL